MCGKFIFLLFFVICIWANTGQASSFTCQIYTPTVESRYHVVTIALSQPRALQVCKSFGMDLVTVPNRRINDLVKKVVAETGDPQGRYWTSARKYSSTDRWRWPDGRTSCYTNWGKGEPNDHITGEYCLMLLDGDKWNDHDCKHEAFFICEDSSPRPRPCNC